MEEDIKILEGYLDRNTQLFEDYGDTAIIQDKEIQAIENLIKGYRSEKEQNTASRKVIVEQCDYIQNKSIPKSKVKEKIEELENKIKATFCKYVTEEEYYNNKFLTGDVAGDYEVIEVSKLIRDRNLLQELMEDK